MADASGTVLLHTLDHPDVRLLMPIQVVFRPDGGWIMGEYAPFEVGTTQVSYDAAIAALQVAIADQYVLLSNPANRTSQGLEAIWQRMQGVLEEIP